MDEKDLGEEFIKRVEELNGNKYEPKSRRIKGNNGDGPVNEIFNSRYIDKIIAQNGKEKNINKQNNKQKIERPKMKKRNRFTGKIKKFLQKHKKGIATVAVTAAAAAGVVAGINAYNDSQTITVPQAISMGETSDSLGLNDDIIAGMQYIDEALNNENIKNEDIIKIIPQVKNVAYDVLASKLAKTLGVNIDSVKFGSESIEEGKNRQYVKVYNRLFNQKYTSMDIPFLYNEHTISKDIANQIKNNQDLDDLIAEVQNGNFNRNDIINRLKRANKDTSKFAAGKMQIDEKGNMTLDKVKLADFDKMNKETSVEKPQLGNHGEYYNSKDVYSVNANGNVDNGDTINLRADDDGR